MPIHINKVILSRRKTIAIHVNEDASLEVRAPKGISDHQIQEFIERHAKWIKNKQALARENRPPPPKKFIDGEIFLYLGKEYPLLIVSKQDRNLVFTGNRFQLKDAALPEAPTHFIKWYRSQAKAYIRKRVGTLSKEFGLDYHKVRISSARTRWGSCSAKGTLNFTYRLLMAPAKIIDYVIIHELVHLEIHNHSRQYWDRVSEILPDYKQDRAWLKTHGKKLVL